MTKLIIAQRISSVQSADIIVILDDGRLHAVGTHDELLKKDTIYQEIYNSQMKGATQMAKAFGGKRPQNLRHTLRRFGDYLGHHKRKLALIGVLTSISALAALIGTYMIRPAVNGILENGSLAYLAGVSGVHGVRLPHRRAVHPGLHPAHGPHGAAYHPGNPQRPVCPPADDAPELLLTRTARAI